MPLHRIVALAGLVALVAAVGCNRAKPGPPAPKPPAVTVVRPGTAPVSDAYEYNGNLDAIETVEVRARVKGYLTKVNFTGGKEIAKDTLLYEIDKREYLTAQSKAKAEVAKARADAAKAAADIQNWEAQIEFARAELKRIEEGVSKAVGSRNDLEKAQATLDVNKAQHTASRAAREAALAAVESAEAALHTTEIQLGYTEIRSKIAGQIGHTIVDEGNLVGQSDPTLLNVMIRVDHLYVYFDVPEKDMLEYLREAERLGLPHPPTGRVPMLIRVPGPDTTWFPGEIDYVEARINTNTGTVRARGVMPNPYRQSSEVRVFFPGEYVQVKVPKGPPRPQLVLPEDAVMTGQEGRYLYVVGANNVVEKRIVTLGPSVWKAPPPEPGVVAPSWTLVNPTPPPPPEKGPPVPARRPVRSMIAVTAGLKPDDRVIVDGLQRSRPGAPVAPEEWAMHPPAPAAPSPKK
ncbi:efflux RND transporter periplasmic adaptor subunit [Gemmata sp.]|uniref:efflux RND transporter periplasmic adaptor subunit n=1 Tax=Gemmata sp. TaxID=1914242 RepID=UPI003F70D17E